MLKIGITGGIGSGKTTVSGIYKLLGIPVYDADTRAKEIMVEDPDVRKAIIALAGEETYDQTGALDRNYLAGRV